MSLPEQEQRQLQEIEQALYKDDPKFVRLMRTRNPRVCYERTIVQALLAVVIGAGLLAAGASVHHVYLEAAGVVIMLLALVCTVVRWRWYVTRIGPARSSAGTKARKGAKHRPGTPGGPRR